MRIQRIEAPDHETVLRVSDAASGLLGLIAIHSTRLGPAAGGLRMRPYPDEAAALADVLRLARGMTFKNAAADLPLGGGKAVILGDPRAKTEAQLAAMGQAVESLGGRYWTAEDMGMTPAEMAILARETRYVAGLPEGPHASGDPSPVTARGVFAALRRTAAARFGSGDLSGRRVAVQGLGSVGRNLAALLHGAGARLVVADIDPDRVARARETFGAEAAEPGAILAAEADILAPCAVGGVLDAGSIPALTARAICGAANNQLATEADADRLHARGILYAPDFVANAGGIANVATEILEIADREGFVAQKIAAAEATLGRIFERAAAEDVSPNRVAETIVAERIAAAG